MKPNSTTGGERQNEGWNKIPMEIWEQSSQKLKIVA